MSDSKVGDLAVVTGGCCSHGVGLIGTVTEISEGYFVCEVCGFEHRGIQAHLDGVAEGLDTDMYKLGWFVLAWLRKIPPLSELEEHREEAAA